MKTQTQMLHSLDQIHMSERRRAQVMHLVKSSSAIVDVLLSIAHCVGLGRRESRQS
jgi:hypothetical protein